MEYPKHLSENEILNLSRSARVKQEMQTVHQYLIDLIPHVKDINKHADKCRNIENALRIQEALIINLKQ